MPEANNNGNGTVSLKIDIAVLKEWRETMEKWNELAFDEINHLGTVVEGLQTCITKLDKRLMIIEFKSGVWGALSGLVMAFGVVFTLVKMGLLTVAQ